MRVIIAGGREKNLSIFNEHAQSFVLAAVLTSGFEVTEIVSGCAAGIDLLGESLCTRLPGKPPIKRFPADWKQHGLSAGPIRNAQMAEYADAIVLIWNGRSRGSRSMKNEARRVGIPIHEVVVRDGLKVITGGRREESGT